MTRPRPPHHAFGASSLVLAGVLWLSLVAGPHPGAQAQADCPPESEPNDTESTATPLQGSTCVAGVLLDGDQDLAVWEVPASAAATLWRIELAGVPDVLTALKVFEITSDPGVEPILARQPHVLEVAQAPDESGPAVLDGLLLPVGRYLLGISRSDLPSGRDDAEAAYEYRIGPGGTAPPVADLEPNDSAEQATPVSNAFEVAGDLQGSTDQYAWTISDAAPRWDVELQVPLGESAALEVLGEDGTRLGNVSVPTFARLYDLAVTPGTYQVRVAPQANETRPYVLRADPSDGEADPEPNDETAQALRLEDGVPTRGRLAKQADHDRYRIVVPSGDRSLRDLRVIWRSDVERRLCLLDANDQPALCRNGNQSIALPALALAPGEHIIDIQGAAAPEDPYLVRLDVSGPAPADFEAEPNDDSSMATQLDPATGMRGRGDATDTDVFRFEVRGEPQLWQVDVNGDDVDQLAWIRPGGAVLERAVVDPDDRSAKLTDLYLVPGEHWISVRVDGLEYELDVTPLGPPDPDAEREPNGDRLLAESYRIGRRQVGRLPTPGDVDVYRFTLAAPEHIRFELVPPDDAAVDLRLRHGEDEIARVEGLEPGATFSWDLALLPGDHLLELRPATPSEGRYELTSERLDPYQLAVDQEPDDSLAWARPVPGSLTWAGAAIAPNDEDWFELPELAVATDLRVEVDDPEARVLMTATSDQIALEDEGDGVFVARQAPPDVPLYLIVRASGPYQVDVSGAGLRPVADLVPLPIEIGLDVPSTPIAAYWPERQRVEGHVRLANSGAEPVEAGLEVSTSHYLWSASLEETEVSLGPGESLDIPIAIDVAADAWADEEVLLAVRAVGPDGSSASGSTRLIALADGPPTGTSPSWDLPVELLGGLNAAYLGFGAVPGGTVDPTWELALFDGVVSEGGGFYRPAGQLPMELSVDLAGEAAVPVAGFILDPLSRSNRLTETPERIELLLSSDGVDWRSVLEATLQPLPVEQAFVLRQPVEARFAMLRILSTYADSPGYVSLGEWKVVAVPGATLGSQPFDVADPTLGGHVVSIAPFDGDRESGPQLLDPERRRDTVRTDAGTELDVVVGFQDDRAAQVERLEWVDPDGSNAATRLDRVDVWTSTQTPLGPWEPLGTWQLTRSTDGSVAPFDPAPPTWARFIRLSGAAQPDAREIELPATLAVVERATDSLYRSILAEWGADVPDGPFEALVTAAAIEWDPDVDAGDQAETAAVLVPDVVTTDRVQIGVDEDWYAIDIPPGMSGLELVVGGRPTVGVALSLLDADGEVRPMAFVRQPDGSVRYEARVEPGTRYWLRVHQPPFSAVFAFDTSGSMGPFLDVVLQGMRTFASEVQPGREAVMIVPFEDPPLLPGWEDDPYLLEDAVNNMAGLVGSSGAEAGIIDAASLLAEREGARAILLVTDAVTSTTRLSGELWDVLASARPIIFSAHIGAAEDPVRSKQLMQDWAASGAGHYAYPSTHGEMDRAFDRMATWMRRPAVYNLRYAALDLDPGSLSVRTGGAEDAAAIGLAPGVGVEIILDTSASMLDKLAGRRRIDIAKESLEQLVGEALADDVPIAIRTFGGTAKARKKAKQQRCQTRLTVPLQPLEQASMLQQIRGLEARRHARTPIAAALAAVVDDLAGVSGTRTVVLVTDGNETCEGDPAAVIEGLKAAGVDVTVNIVGFALEDEGLKAQMAGWAELGDGSYFDAAGAADLASSLAAAVRAPFRVYGPDGTVYEGGTVDGQPVLIDPGTYRVEVLTDPPLEFDEVVVGGGESVVLDLRAAE